MARPTEQIPARDLKVGDTIVLKDGGWTVEAVAPDGDDVLVGVWTTTFRYAADSLVTVRP